MESMKSNVIALFIISLQLVLYTDDPVLKMTKIIREQPM